MKAKESAMQERWEVRREEEGEKDLGKEGGGGEEGKMRGRNGERGS